MASESGFLASEELRPVVEEFLPICRRLGQGRYAVSVGGSYGKNAFDAHSDVDFRLYADEFVTSAEIRNAIHGPIEDWAKKGVKVDGVWTRRIADIDQHLKAWLAGRLMPVDLVWAIWGYHLLPDLYHQKAIEDPFGVIAGWKDKLRIYPAALKEAIVKKHLGSLRYWRKDYHYQSKVQRKDAVFLSGLSARLVHDMMQVLFALNEVYFVGDGQNLMFASGFRHKPPDFEGRVMRALYPPLSDCVFEVQRDVLLSLIDDIEQLVGNMR